jgi:hypothetical protein
MYCSCVYRGAPRYLMFFLHGPGRVSQNHNAGFDYIILSILASNQSTLRAVIGHMFRPSASNRGFVGYTFHKAP